MFLMPVGDDVDHRDFPVVGVLLITANVMVFFYVLRLVSGGANFSEFEAFYLTWGLVPADLPQGRMVGLVTHMFLHGGLGHLVGNMICLWAFVHGLERTFGSAAFAVLFIVWGIAGGLAHSLMHWGDTVPLVGASGAIAGMIGAYWVAFGPFTKIRTVTLLFMHVIKADVPTGVYVGIWIVMQLLGASASSEESVGVAWYAHLGGFAAGCLTMAILKNRTKAELVVTRHGDMYIENRQSNELPVEETGPAVDPVPTNCCYCNTPLGEENRIAANLIRCPNPDCGRCIYLEEASPVAGGV